MRNPVRDLRIRTGQSTLPQTPTGTSFNRTPPLDPPLAMDSPSPSKGLSRSVTPYTDSGSPSQQSNPFPNPFDSPKSSRFSRIKQSLKDNWAAGTDPKHYHEKRRRGTPDYSDNSTSNSRSTSRQRPRTEAPPSDRLTVRPGPSRAATNRPAPTSHPSGLGRNAGQRAKDKRRREKAVRKIERDASQRLKIKHHREFERGDFSSMEGTGSSPLHAPLHMLAKANDARDRADEKRKMHFEWERRRSEIERRRAHAPAELQSSHDKGNAHGQNPYERAEPHWREPEYDKDPYEKASPSSPALDPLETEHEYASAAADNSYQAPAPEGDDPFEESSSDEQILEIINAYSHRWSGLQPLTPSPRLNRWSGLQPLTPSPQHNPYAAYAEPELKTEDEEEEEEVEVEGNPCFHPARHGWGSAQDQPLSPQPEPAESRGEFEGIVNKLTMPDQEQSRRERDTYYEHVTRRRRDAAGKEYF